MQAVSNSTECTTHVCFDMGWFFSSNLAKNHEILDKCINWYDGEFLDPTACVYPRP